MPSLSRTVLVIFTLAASVSLAKAGDKAAFNAPPRDAMPDITPIIVKAPEAPSAVAAVAQPAEAKPVRGKHANHVAKGKAPSKMDASNQHDPVARADPLSSGTAVTAAVQAPATSSDKPATVPSSAVVLAAAAPNTEAASQTPGPPPVAKPDGPREQGSDTVSNLVAKHALANGVPVRLAQAVVKIESRGNAHASNAGALGLMQIKFGTARAAGFSGPAVGLFVADTNLRYGMKILGDAYRAAGGDTCGALMRYQSGHLATRMSRANAVYCSRARAIMAGA